MQPGAKNPDNRRLTGPARLLASGERNEICKASMAAARSANGEESRDGKTYG